MAIGVAASKGAQVAASGAKIASQRIQQAIPAIQRAINHPQTPPAVKSGLRNAINILIGR